MLFLHAYRLLHFFGHLTLSSNSLTHTHTQVFCFQWTILFAFPAGHRNDYFCSCTVNTDGWHQLLFPSLSFCLQIFCKRIVQGCCFDLLLPFCREARWKKKNHLHTPNKVLEHSEGARETERDHFFEALIWRGDVGISAEKQNTRRGKVRRKQIFKKREKVYTLSACAQRAVRLVRWRWCVRVCVCYVGKTNLTNKLISLPQQRGLINWAAHLLSTSLRLSPFPLSHILSLSHFPFFFPPCPGLSCAINNSLHRPTFNCICSSSVVFLFCVVLSCHVFCFASLHVPTHACTRSVLCLSLQEAP